MNSQDREDRIDAVIAEFIAACEAGAPPDRAALLAKHPELADELTGFFADHDRMRQAIGPLDSAATGIHLAGVTGTFDGADAGAVAAPLGTIRYFGDYELTSEIARGGMGVVFKARQVSLNRTIALKMILRGGFASETEVRRFRAEAESAANLDHPNVLPIYEVGEHDEHQYFSMKLVEGGTLAGQLARASGQIALELVALLVKVARAVHFAHQRGILHRDLKPSNVLLDREGTPYVADFGLAKKVEDDSSLTQTGAVVGTPSYVAPEQARAERQLSTAVDVYSLGAILYEILTGRPPFRANSVYETIRQVIEKLPDHPRLVRPTADRDLSVIAMKCLEKDPLKRYESAAALADDLDRRLRGEPILARPASRLERAGKWVRRNPVVAALIGLAVVLLLAGSAVSTYFALAARREARDAVVERQRAENEERRAIDRLARTYLTNGTQRLDADDGLGSLPFFVEALQLDERDPDRAAIHRARLAETFRRAPKLVGFWTPASPTRSVAFLPHGRIITGHADGAARVWELDGGALLLTLSHGGPASAVLVSPDARWAVTHYDRPEFWQNDRGSLESIPEHKRAVLWDLATGRAVHAFEHDGLVGQAAFSKDGSRLVTVSNRIVKNDPLLPIERGSARVWDVVTGKPLTTPLELGEETAVRSGHFDPSGARVVLEPTDGSKTARVWDVATGKPVPVRLNPPGLDGKPYTPSLLRFSPDGHRILASTGSWPRLFDTHSGEPVGEEIRPGLGDVHPSSIRFTHDGRYFTWETEVNSRAVLDGVPMQGGVQTFATEDGNQIGPQILHEGRRKYSVVQDHATTPDGRYVATGCDDGTARVWSPRLRRAETPYLPHEGPVNSVAISRDGRLLLTATSDHVRVWDLSFQRIADPVPGEVPGRRKTIAESGRLGVTIDSRQIDSTPDDDPTHPSVKLLQSETNPSEGATVEVWDRVALRFRGPPLRHPKRVLQANLTEDGRFLATRTVDHRWHVWDVVTGNPIGPGGQHAGPAARLLLLPGARYLATVVAGPPGPAEPNRDTLIRLWDVATGAEAIPAMTVKGPGPRLYPAPDGVRFAVGNVTDCLVRILAADGRPAVTIPTPGPETSVKFVAFSPGGTRLATAGSTPAATRVWDASTGEPLGPPLAHAKGVNHVAFDPTGERVVTASDDGTARIWDAVKGDRLTPAMRLPTAVVEAHFIRNGSCIAARSRDPAPRFGSTVEGDAFRAWDARTGAPLGPLVPEALENEEQDTAAYARIDEVEPDLRPIEVLRAWAELLSGQRMDETGGLVALMKDEFAARWETVRTRDPGGLKPPLADVRAWHRHELKWLPQSGASAEERTNGLHHLNALIAANPAVPAWRERRGLIHAQTGRWNEAHVDFEAAIAMGVDHEYLMEAAPLLAIRVGDRAAVVRHLEVLFRRGRTMNRNVEPEAAAFRSRMAGNFESAVLACVLAKLPGTDFAALARECDQLGDSLRVDCRAAALYRVGRFADAATLLAGEIAARHQRDTAAGADAWVWLGLAEYGRGNRLAGLACLGIGFNLYDVQSRGPDYWKNRLVAGLLDEEAQPWIKGESR